MQTDHLEEEQIQRLLDGELASALDAPVRAHLEACEVCRDRVAATRREEEELDALLRFIDHPVPRVDAEQVALRARPRRSVPWQRWAASIVVSISLAGAAWALPGSPLRRWVAAVANRITIGGVSAPVRDAPVALAPEAPTFAGISLIPDGDIAIMFTASQSSGMARVAFSFGPELTIQAPPGAARFASEVGRLVVDNTGSTASFDIRLPRSAQRVEIRVHGERRFLKDGVRIVTAFPADSSGTFLIPLTAPQP